MQAVLYKEYIILSMIKLIQVWETFKAGKILQNLPKLSQTLWSYSQTLLPFDFGGVGGVKV